jgi:plastocyanin
VNKDLEFQNPKFFDPELVSIPGGSVVNWINNDESFHTVTLTEGFDSGIIPPGNRSSHQFFNQGIFNYQCKIHPYMSGELRSSAENPTDITISG